MIRFIDISMEIGGKSLLKSVSFTAKEGETVVFVGRNGSGKTMLLNALSGLAPIGFNADVNGVIEYNGAEIDIGNRDYGRLLNLFTYIAFNPDLQIIFPQVYDEISILPDSHEALRLAGRLGVGDYLDREIDELSVGEKKRLALMIYLSIGGKIVLMDEPSSDLDIWSIENLISIITAMKREGLTFLLTTNDPYFALSVADKIVILDSGEVKEICESHKREDLVECYLSASKRYGLRALRGSSRDLSTKPCEERDKVAEVSAVSLSLRGRHLLKDIDLDIHRGCIECLIGSNGSGKTTLGKIIAGLIKPSEGRVSIYTGTAPLYVPQEYHLSLWGPSLRHIFKRYSSKGMDALRYYGIHHLIDRHPLTLSSGEKLKAVLARASAIGSDIEILDEPTNILDRDGLAALNRHVESSVSEERAVVLITHDIETILSLCSHVYLLDNGKIVYRGAPEDVFKGIYGDAKNRLSGCCRYLDVFMELYFESLGNVI